MVTVECLECPIRNFCPEYNSVHVPKKVNYHDCPLYKMVDKMEEEEEENPYILHGKELDRSLRRLMSQ